MMKMFSLIRPKQWIKNFFVFMPMFFGGNLLVASDLLSAFVTFVAFCLAASSIYCLNDIIDMEADRQHPEKCHRPIASGQVSIRQGYILMAVLFILSMASLLLLPAHGWNVMVVIVLYWLLNIAYCLVLKLYSILDVCVVSFGFVLRILAGGEATGVVPSHWLVLMTFLVALFMAFAKRHDDVWRMNETGKAPRKNTSRYNLVFINQAITITASVTLVCYVMYTVSPEVVNRFQSPYLYLTTIFVLLGLLRYIQIAVVDRKSGDPTQVVTHDRTIQLIILAWALSFALVIYVL